MIRFSRLRLSFAVAALSVASASAGVVKFTNTTDTIAVSTGTTLTSASTYEARILFTTALNRNGFVFNEWTNGQEDKFLGAGPSNLGGYNYPLGAGLDLTGSPTVTLNTWHHIAMVYDGAQERLYLDGVLIASRASSGSVGNGAGLPFIGAIFRDAAVQTSFGGYLDWLRVSNTARYSGASFSAPVAQPATDASTQLLYYFDENSGTTTADQSSFGRTGTLGTGFGGATSPTFTADPVPPAPVGTPTLSEWAIALLVMAFIGIGATKIRKAPAL